MVAGFVEVAENEDVRDCGGLQPSELLSAAFYRGTDPARRVGGTASKNFIHVTYIPDRSALSQLIAYSSTGHVIGNGKEGVPNVAAPETSIRFASHQRSTHTSDHHLHDCAPSARTYKVAYGEEGKCKRRVAKTR
jgi:hypothetical protein